MNIVGRWGSGRSSTARAVVEDLEKSGTEVYFLAGNPSLKVDPFSGVFELSFINEQQFPRGHSSIVRLADAFAVELGMGRNKVIVLDDIENIDHQTLAVVALAQTRTSAPLLYTSNAGAVADRSNPIIATNRWPEARIELKPLRYEEVNELVLSRLGHSVDAAVITRIFNKSAGNPRLARVIAESAAMHGSIKLRDDVWEMMAPSLWNTHLEGTVESMLSHLCAEEATALKTLTMLGSETAERFLKLTETHVLDSVEAQGFIALLGDGKGKTLITVQPPVIADYFHNQARSSARARIASRIQEVLGISEQELAQREVSQPEELDSLNVLRRESTVDDATLARYFQQQQHMHLTLKREAWLAQPSLANAVDFLAAVWDSPHDEIIFSEVFELTSIAADDDALLVLRFITLQAQWLAISRQELDKAQQLLMGFGSEHPTWAGHMDAYCALLETILIAVPERYEERLAAAMNSYPETGMVATILAYIRTVNGFPREALEVLDALPDTAIPLASKMADFIRGLALCQVGEVRQSLDWSLAKRADARSRLQKSDLYSHSYVAAIALMQLDLWDEAEQVLSSVLALARPGLLFVSTYEAMLRLTAVIVARTNRKSLAATFIREAEDSFPGKHPSKNGPLPGMQTALNSVVIEARLGDSQRLEIELAASLADSAERGYVFAAVSTGIVGLCIAPSYTLYDEVQRLVDARHNPAHARLLKIASFALAGSSDDLMRVVTEYTLDGDEYLISLLLRSVTRMHRDNDERDKAFDVETALVELARKHPSLQPSVSREPRAAVHLLTEREREVALLAGTLTNVEVGQRLGISARTVENHISNALRKTGAASRVTLCELVSGQPRSETPLRSR
ncbi:helix-turn-helix transcriptional regulator [Lysinibacter cavernae]|uniref:DNA-binding CsgD family transcriptional regulator n=1 Tax=Lysinibacter cavernae TaxID=1640652 RepID=A0A7X5R0I2_9MICO|nr:DNA-binding CsgD family transcriptional regulator [Lysinibacter cavernae]